MPQISEAEVFRACRILFGSELHLNREFLRYLQPSGVRSAYRKKAKVTHPDRYAVSATGIHSKQVRLFQNLNQAHELVQSFLKQRDLASVKHHPGSNPGHHNRPRRSQQRSRPFSKTYRGPFPARPLQFGLFLYYRGIIPFNVVIAAITWQRQQRPTMGEIAQRWGWLNEEDVTQILNLRGLFGRFGERAEQLGLLSPLQVRAILIHQRTRQKQLGRYFIEHGFITEPELDRLLGELSDHNLRHRHSFPGQYYYQR